MKSNKMERKLYSYEPTTQKIMNLRRNIVISQIQIKEIKKESIIYENQDNTAKEIVKNLENRKISNIMVIAKTQSGKTGTMSALLKNYLETNKYPIPTENIYIITGLSSKEWVNQTQERMPDSIKERVYHRDKIVNQFVTDITGKQNVLVIIDEIQIAAKRNQTLARCFHHAGFDNLESILERDIKIVEFTATPDGTIYDLMKWKDNAFKLKMEPGFGYTSCYDLLRQDRVFQYQDLCCYDKEKQLVDIEEADKNILQIYEIIIKKYDKPKYHIIRTKNGEDAYLIIDNFKRVFGSEFKFYKYDKESEIEDINTVLVTSPSKTTFIFIKEKLRCAKTLIKTNLGILYERYTECKPDDAVIIQGLIGRITGYDDTGSTICFTNKESIEKYEKLWISNFEDRDIKWKSKTTSGNKIKTFLDIFHDSSSSEDESEELVKPIVFKCKTFEEAKIYVKRKFGDKRSPHKPKKDQYKPEFYVSTIRSNTKIRTCREVDTSYGLNDRNLYRIFPCYENKENPESLQFWVTHK